MIDVATLERLLPDFMVRQRWYGFGDVRPERVEVTDFEVLARLVARARLGARPPGVRR